MLSCCAAADSVPTSMPRHQLNARLHPTQAPIRQQYKPNWRHDDLHWLPIHQQITYKLCTIVCKCLHEAAPSYLTEMCVLVAASTGHHCLHSVASNGAQNENDNVWIIELCSLQTTCLEWFATNLAYFIHHTRTVPKQTKDNTILLGLWDMTCCFRDCLDR